MVFERISEIRLRMYEAYALFLSGLPNRDTSTRIHQLKLRIRDLKRRLDNS